MLDVCKPSRYYNELDIVALNATFIMQSCYQSKPLCEYYNNYAVWYTINDMWG